MKLYVDMDGVLANFLKAARKEHGLDEDADVMEHKFAVGKEEFWKTINRNPSFWLDLEPLPPNLEEVWDRLRTEFPHIAILSAPSRSNPECIPHKNRWLDEHVGPGLRLFAKDKAQYACPRSVLVDDLEKNVKPWREAGGIAIHFKGEFDEEFWDELAEARRKIP